MTESPKQDRAPLPSADERLAALERLLAISSTDRGQSLAEAAHLIAEMFRADKVDVFSYEPSSDSLVAVGTSDTPMGRTQIQLGLNRLAVANGGSAVRVFETGEPHLTRQADVEGELRGIVQGLGVRAEIIVPVDVAGARRGVLLASSHVPEYFSWEHVQFLAAVARWIGLVAERIQLAERMKAEAQEMGRRLAAEELIAVLAHDLRNHITSLRGRLDLLKRLAARSGDSDYEKQAEGAIVAADRLGRLVRDLLDSERLERGLFALRTQAVDVLALVREAVGPFDTAETLVKVRGPSGLWISADPHRLRQAIENLVSNAIAHSPDGAQVRIEVSPASRDGVEGAQITVQDEGPGIPAELVPRLFERFVRGRRSGGLGLGLFLASRITSAHGGTLTLDSAPGTPACFTLWLPVFTPD